MFVKVSIDRVFFVKILDLSFNGIDSASIENLFPPSLTILDLSGNQAINIQRDSLTSLRYYQIISNKHATRIFFNVQWRYL